MKSILIATALAWASTSAWAVNKCTGSDGKVSYQAEPCPASAKGAQLKIATDSGIESQGGWRFRRIADELTGQVNCYAVSAITTPKIVPGIQGFNFKPVNLVAVVMDGSVNFGVRTSDDKTLFHTDTSSIGFKTDVGSFTSLSRNSSAHVLMATQSEALVNEFSKAREVTLRLRFWPYETLVDMSPISMSGYTQALAQAKSCASR